MVARLPRWSVLLVTVLLLTAGAEKKNAAADGTVFYFHPGVPKFINCDAEFRDPTGERWPNFFYGRPAEGGTLTYSASASKGEYVVSFDQMCQPNGDQSRKVLADLITAGAVPKVGLQVKSIGPITAQLIQEPGAKKPIQADAAPVAAILTLGSRQGPLNGQATFRWLRDKGSEAPNGVLITTQFSAKGEELGLSSMAGKAIDLRFTACATLEATAPAEKPKKGKQ